MLRPVVLRVRGTVPEMQVEAPPVEGPMMGFVKPAVLLLVVQVAVVVVVVADERPMKGLKR